MILLHAPLSGWAGDLDEVPDPVFAERMMGDGLAIDPTETVLVAPCDGTILLVPPTAHSVTLRAENGAEILMHIGIETVALGGRGFEAHVATGQSVRRGDRLVSFDLDKVAAGAASLVTPIVLANGDDYAFVPLAAGLVTAGEPLAEIVPRGAAKTQAAAGREHVQEIVVPLPNGIHARPAARIAACAKGFSAELSLRAHGRTANARSPVAMMVLGAQHGDALAIVGSGTDAEAAVSALAHLIAHDIEEASAPLAQVETSVPAPARAGGFSGVCAVAGLAIGPAFHLRVRDIEVAEAGNGASHERQSLARARTAVADRLSGATRGGGTAASVAAAHLALLEDVELIAAAEALVAAGKSAGFAWRAAVREQAEQLGVTGNSLLAERVDDLLDIERQVLAELGGADAGAAARYPQGAVLLADEILPSQLMQLDTCRPAAICTARGGPTSHAAVMAAAAGVPMLVAAGSGVTQVPNGATIFVDAAAGFAAVDPDAGSLAGARERIAAAEARNDRQRALALEPCRTRDGTRIEVFANLGSVAHAWAAVAEGAEGCGLLRSEFLFLDRASAPDEAEQRAAYQAIADALGDRPLIVRTLDVGGDKPIPYLPIPPEDNPALGLRGVRASLWRTDLLDAQLRAILGVTPAGRCRIMVPMIVSLAELRAVRERLDEAAAQLGVQARVELGIMVETPAAAALADQLAAEADFFSVGSNDLTQYTLAMDRGNPLVAAQVDSFHPAVLRLIAGTARGAALHARPLGVCGGLASDPGGAALLVGLGATELSVAPSCIAGVKATLRALSIEECRDIADRALAAESPEAVRLLVHAALSAQGEA